jgi:hypothetical protein
MLLLLLLLFIFIFIITFCTLFSPWNAVHNQANNCWYRRQKKEENDWLMPQKRRSHYDSQRFPYSQQQEQQQQQQRSQRYCAGSTRWLSFTWNEKRETAKEIRKPVYPPPQVFFFSFFSTRYGDISFQETVEKTNSQVCWVPDLEKSSKLTRCEEESRSDNKPTKQ